VWQVLAEELKDVGFTVLAIALDTTDAARPWIEAAKPAYPCLIDVDHHVAALYNLVNVPQAVWIDEAGRIGRPPETAGADDGFRAMDRNTGVMSAEVLAQRQQRKTAYLDAVRHWARHGSASVNALDAREAIARLPPPSDAEAEAHAWFRLGQHLQASGQAAEALAAFSKATALHPASWAMWRQTAAKDARGFASGAAFWARVDALGDRPYYPPADIVAPDG
jgi:tetratricopeptide (TPR) repeat protein